MLIFADYTCVELINQIVIGYDKSSLIAMLPIIPFTITCLGAVFIFVMKMSKTTPLQDLGVDRTDMYYKAEKIYFKIDSSADIVLSILMAFTVLPIIAIFNNHFLYYVNGMMPRIEVINNYIIGLTSMIITVSVVIIVFDKKYYLVFTIREVLQECKFVKSLAVSIISCICSTIFTITLLDQEISTDFDVLRLMLLELSVVFNVLSVSYCFYIIVKIMFSEQNSEFILLEKLYRIFWFKRVEKINIRDKKDWQRDAVNSNIEYLSIKYVKQCKKIKISKIKEMGFATTIGCYKNKWYKKAAVKFIVITVVCSISSTVFNYLVLREQIIGLSIVNLTIVIISILVAIILKPLSMQFAVLRMYSDTWGYYIRDNKERFIPRDSINGYSKYNRYFKITNSLNAFMYLLIDIVGERSVIEEAVASITDCISTLTECSMFAYFPIFTIGFFSFEKNIKIEQIKKIYSVYVTTEDMKRKFYNMLNSQLLYLTRKYPDYHEELNKYTEWLSNEDLFNYLGERKI